MATRLTLAIVLIVVASEAHADSTPATNEDSARAIARAKLGRRLEITGTVVWGAAYLVNAGIAIAQVSAPCGLGVQNQCGNKGAYASGLVPVVGPWIQIGYFHDDSTTMAVYAVPAAIQIVGLALVVAGVVIRERAEKRLPRVSVGSPAIGLSIAGIATDGLR